MFLRVPEIDFNSDDDENFNNKDQDNADNDVNDGIAKLTSKNDKFE